MKEHTNTPTRSGGIDLSRRQIIGAIAAAAGAMTVSREAMAAGDPANKCVVRVAAVSYSPPFYNHKADVVNLSAIRDTTAKVMHDRPDFVCYPECCAGIGQGFEKGIETAPELAPYVAEVGKIAREFNVALVVPFIERQEGKVYNSVPIVDRQGNLVIRGSRISDLRRSVLRRATLPLVPGRTHRGSRGARIREMNCVPRRSGLVPVSQTKRTALVSRQLGGKTFAAQE